MLRPLPENHMVALLQRCYSSPTCLSRQGSTSLRAPRLRRSYAALSAIEERVSKYEFGDGIRSKTYRNLNKDREVTSVAVLGGGITGLTAAHDLLKAGVPKVDLYEASDRLGGWVRSSEPVPVEGGQLVFEAGPRTLRISSLNGARVSALAYEIGLRDEFVITTKDSPAAKKRFLYYPDRLVEMPNPTLSLYGNLWSILTEPIFKGLFSALWGEHVRSPRPKTSEILDDESIGRFLERRLGTTDIGDNIASAVLHGIYAGDIYQLSARSLLPAFYELEGRYGSITDGFIEKYALASKKQSDLVLLPTRAAREKAEFARSSMLMKLREDKEFFHALSQASVISFKGGMQTFTNKLAEEISKAKELTVKTNTFIKQIDFGDVDEKGLIKLSTSADEAPEAYSHVISTLSPSALRSILPSGSTHAKSDYIRDRLATIPNVTVMVVNLYYSEPHIHNVQGFGYLIPRSVPYAQNPEMALGVVFDSDSAPVDTAPGTKLTVMLGGHYWSHLSPDELPTEEEGIDMARAVLARHLKITEKPEATACSLQRDCIPQYTVGHSAELKEINRSLNSLSDGRLAVAGAWTDGVGLNDCAVSGMRAADETVNGINPNYMNEYHGGPMKWTASSAVGRGTFPPAFQALVNRMRRR